MSSNVLDDIKSGKGLKPLGRSSSVLDDIKIIDDIKSGKGLKPLGYITQKKRCDHGNEN